jgi:predicted phosphodiesterase
VQVAAIYDIHGNLPALEAVLDEIRLAQVDRVVVGGDVFPGPMPGESLARLLELDVAVEFILGDGDREVLSQAGGTETTWYRTAPERWRAPVRWTAQQLSGEHLRLVGGWPATCRLSIAGLGDVLFCHATPRSDTEIFTRLTPEERLVPLFNLPEVRLVVCGHTHMQFNRTVDRVRVVNAGSVGMPFGEPGANWLLLGPGVELRHTRYELGKAAERIRRTAYPQAEEFAMQNVLKPPSEEKTLEAFSRDELRTNGVARTA